MNYPSKRAVKPSIFLLLVAWPILAFAISRQSANYTIPADVLDAGGRATSSASYQQTSSTGLISGIASGAAGALIVKSGYIAQLGPDNIALQVVSAVSRKVHSGAGTFDINLPLTTPAGIECRTGAIGGNHRVVIVFATPVTVSGLSIMSRDGMASGTRSVSGATVTVDLSAVANAQTVGITLLNVSNGSTTADIVIPMGVLAGDTNGSGVVTASDIGQTKSQSGQLATGANFRTDVNANGAITASDIGLVKSLSGSSLP